MELDQDSVFTEERARFRLRFTCEDCALFDEVRGCAHGYPTERHRSARYTNSTAKLLFCKDFTLAQNP